MSIASSENGWVSCPDPCPDEVLERARAILLRNRYCTLSTCSADGMPWASPVLYCLKGLNIFWSSAIASRHSQYLYGNGGKVAIAIYATQSPQGRVEGLFFTGTASELDPEDVVEVMGLLFEKAGGTPPDRNADDYLGESPRRFYSFEPEEGWITGDRVQVGRQLVDTKIQLDLDRLSK